MMYHINMDGITQNSSEQELIRRIFDWEAGIFRSRKLWQSQNCQIRHL